MLAEQVKRDICNTTLWERYVESIADRFTYSPRSEEFEFTIPVVREIREISADAWDCFAVGLRFAAFEIRHGIVNGSEFRQTLIDAVMSRIRECARMGIFKKDERRFVVKVGRIVVV